MIKQASEAGLAVLGATVNALKTVKSADSLIAYTQPARVEPIVLLDADCLYAEMTPDVMQSLQAIFTGYYLQAWDLSVNIGNIDVIRQLEKLNPNRDPLSNVQALESLTDDNLTFKLPFPGDSQVALETDHDTLKSLRELTNLSVGKLIQVEVKNDQGKIVAKIPVSIRLLVNSIPTANLISILSVGGENTSFKERYHQWKAGEIEFFRDLVMCQDLIDKHKKNLMADTTGTLDAILHRRSGNAIASILSQNLSVASASNIAVISSDTATQLELQVGALKNFKVRQKLFDKTYLMLLAVLDKEWERVTIYSRGIPESTSLSARDLKTANKNTGPDISDILSAYKAGSSPSL